MEFTNVTRGWVAALGLLALVGCASNQPTSDESEKQAEGTLQTQPETKPAEAPVPPKPPVVLINPTVISFEKMSVVLDEKGRETIAEIGEKAKESGKITVTGFCDRRQIRNSMDSAVARAVVTRDELIAQGVAPSNIVIKFSTVTPKKHAAEIKFEELELTKKSVAAAKSAARSGKTSARN